MVLEDYGLLLRGTHKISHTEYRHADTRKHSLLVVAAFAVCILARMCLPVCEHPAVAFGSSAHGSLLVQISVCRDDD